MAAHAITSHDINALTGRTYPELEPRGSSLRALLRQLAVWYAGYRRYRETVAELSRLNDYLLADIGISRHQIHEIAQATRTRAG